MSNSSRPPTNPAAQLGRQGGQNRGLNTRVLWGAIIVGLGGREDHMGALMIRRGFLFFFFWGGGGAGVLWFKGPQIIPTPVLHDMFRVYV